MRETTDAQLVAGAVSGDNPAFDELVSRYRTRVYHLALSKVRGRDNALDIAQEAFVQAYLSLGSLREPERFSAWLSGIVSNVCKMHFRRMGEVPVAPEMLGQLEASPEPDPNAALAREALDRLPNGTRSAAILYFIEEMKQSEISDFLGISLAAVKSRIRDARTSLRKEMIHMVKQTGRKEEPGDEFARSLKHRLELARWYTGLSKSIQAGVTIMGALDRLRQADYSEPIKRDTARMMDEILREATISEALEHCPALQTPEAKHLILAGEYGGMLELTTGALADYMQLRSIQESIEMAILCRTIGGLLLGRNKLTMALRHASDVAQNELVRQVTREMLQSIEAGGTMRAVADRFSDALPAVMLQAIRAGEKSGTLGYALNWAADQLASDASRLLAAPRISRPAWMDKVTYSSLEQAFGNALAEEPNL